MFELFINANAEFKDIPKESSVDYCLLENNLKQINQIYSFFKSPKKILLVNGYTGSGKTQIVNFSLNAIRPEVLKLHYSCLETTTVDDMFLNFFETFKDCVTAGKIIPPKNKVENFTQKINSYFNSINVPILIFLDSFEAIIKENRDAIVDFLNHISKFSNIKIVLVSRVFAQGIFEDELCERVTILPLSQKLYEKYLKSRGIKQLGVFSNELYKHTKGYYMNVVLSVNIMQLRQMSLMNFFEQFSNSYMSFPEFLVREIVALIDPVSIHLFRLLAVMRIPIHIKLLKLIHMYDEERITFFIRNSILLAEGEYIFLKEDFRNYIETKIPDNVRIKLHKACIDLYNTQLPLKPSERDLLLSRQTMRNEIDYHSLFIPRKIEIKPSEVEQIPARQDDVLPPVAQELVDKSEDADTETKEEKINKISFVIPDESVLDDIVDTIKDYVETTQENTKLEQVSGGMSLRSLIESAMRYEREYDYKRVIMLYQQALTKQNDEDFYTLLPTIYIRLAKAYKNLSSWYEALEYYTQAQDFYLNVSNKDKAAEISLEIANIYYIIYKNDNAKFILSELEKQKDLPNVIKIKTNLALAKIVDDIDKELDYYKNSISLIEVSTPKPVLSELYYKYAVLCDETDDIKMAARYYKKCIELDSNSKHNPYLSNALSNLAELYDEAGSVNQAISCYEQSIEVDLRSKNNNGLYSSYTRIAEIYSQIDKTKALGYFNKALEYANILDDAFCVSNANLNLGDFNFGLKKYEQAYKYYSRAHNVAKLSLSKENVQKIENRIVELKHSVGEKEFELLVKKYAQ